MPSRIIPIDIPMRGLNTVQPFLENSSGFARELTNFTYFSGLLTQRPASSSTLYNNSLSGSVHWFDINTVGSTGKVILSNGDIRQLDDGSGATSIGGTPGYNATQVKHVSLDLVFGCQAPRLAAAPFTAWTFTTLGITATDIRCGCSHRGRLYVADADTIEYSAVAAVTGTMDGSVSMAEFLDGQSISRIFSFTVAPNVTTENVLVVFGDGGRVLFWQGSYPGSSTWSLIGKYDMPRPISNVGFVEIDSDIWVSTPKYAYWLRDLFGGGAQTAYQNSPTIPIENYWANETWSNNKSLEEVSHSFYYPRVDAIISQCSQTAFTDIADYQNEGAYWVYHRKYQAWALWLMTPMFTPVQLTASTETPYGTGYSPELKYANFSAIEDNYSGTSNTIDVESVWETFYFTPFAGRLQKVDGGRINFRSPWDTGYLHKIRATFDTTYTSSSQWYTQSTVTDSPPLKYTETNIDLSPNTSDFYTANVGVGGQGETFTMQYVMKRPSGDENDLGGKIAGGSVYVSDGGFMF